jgi:hypothetical protein
MQEVISKVFVGTSPVFELLASMFRLQSHESLSNIESTQTAQDFELELWVDRTRKIIPNEIKQSLELFFH